MTDKAPQFKLEAASGLRTIGHPHSLPRVLILLFQDEATADAARLVNEVVRGVYEDSEDMFVASVADMSAVPRFMLKMSKNMLLRAYEKAAENIPEGIDPADYIILLPDWSGQVFKAFEVGDVSKKALMVIIDHEGRIVLRKRGGNLGQAALKELDKLI